jgi:putative transposase
MKTQNVIQYQRNCHRFHYEGDSHFLTFSCYERKPALRDDQIKRIVGTAIADTCSYLSVDLWAYVIMPEHVHLLIHPRLPDFKTGHFLVRAKRKTTNARNKKFPDNKSPLWLAGGGYDRNIFSADELQEKLRYIHLNPVRKGISSGEREYVWFCAPTMSFF